MKSIVCKNKLITFERYNIYTKAMQTKISEKFNTLFGCSGEFFASAGRINLIGEHTDYNGGFVFPGAIDKGIMAEIKLNGTGKVCAYSLDLDEYVEFVSG